MVTIYQIYQDDKTNLYDFSVKIKSDDIYETILDLYSNRKLKSDYIGIFNHDIQVKHDFNLDLSKITEEYDMYIAPLNVNARHNVFNKLYEEFPYLYDIVIDKLLNYLKLPVKLKPKLGIYDNSIIAKKEIYKDYIKNYLKPSIYLLNLLNIDQTVIHNILNLLWSIYYEYNKKRLRLKIFRKKIVRTKKSISTLNINALVTVVDNFKNTKVNNIDVNYDYVLIKYTKHILFKTNLKMQFTQMFYNLNDNSVIELLKVNNAFLTDFNYMYDINIYDIVVYSNSAKILTKNIFKIIEAEDVINNNINELFILTQDDIVLIYAKPSIMQIFYSLYNTKKYYIDDLSDYAKHAMSKMGIRVNEVMISQT